MPPPIKTVEEIIAELNASGGTWVRMPGFFALNTINLPAEGIGDRPIAFGIPTGGSVLLAFINLQNAEVRTFVAKYINIPERGS